jgi:hypothetical protein
MMRRTSRVLQSAFLALAMAAASGLVAQGHAGAGSCASDKAATAGASGCPSAAKAGGCPSAAKGCPGAAVGGCPSAKASKAGPAGCGSAMAGMPGGVVMPDGTKMTRMDVDGGIDLIFTGRDLGAIRASLDGHIAACSTMKEKPCAGQACTVTTTENSVVLSVRGANAESCCTMMTMSLSGGEPKAEPVKPVKKKWSWWKRN